MNDININKQYQNRDQNKGSFIPNKQNLKPNNQNIDKLPLQTSSNGSNVDVPKIKKPPFNFEKVGYYLLLISAIIVPIIFVPSTYISQEIVKTVVITTCVLLSAVFYGITIFRENSMSLPPKKLFWTGTLIIVSMLISATLSVHFGKSFWGKGFEVSTAGFIIVLFVSGFLFFETIRRNQSRLNKMFKMFVLAYLLISILTILRLIFGADFLSMAILNNVTSTVLGSWFDYGLMSMSILIITVCGFSILPSSTRSKILYGITGLISLFIVFIVNQKTSWLAMAISMVVVMVALYSSANAKPELGKWKSKISRIPWVSTIFFILSLVLIWYGVTIAGPVIKGTNTAYVELSLPWQLTLDVVNGSVKSFPWFGVGPNNFGLAFSAFKPNGFNQSAAWNVEFNTGFGFIPTQIVTQGLAGFVLWILLLVFIGLALTKLIRRLPHDPNLKFVSLSAAAVVVYLLVNLILYTPSHAMLFALSMFMGIFMAILVSTNIYPVTSIVLTNGIKKWIFKIVMIVLIVAMAIGCIVYIKDFIAFAYFSNGVKKINISQDYEGAKTMFVKASSINKSDIYLQALAENYRLHANKIATTATTSAPEITDKIMSLLKDGIDVAREAIAYDPSNYYNYISEARVSDLASTLKVENSLENSVRAYSDAIRINPLNPAIYLSLAQAQANAGKYTEATQTIGAALQVKPNYLEAVYLLSQIQVAQGNLQDAIVSTQFATQLNSTSPLLFFQLGLLNYNAKNYAASVTALEEAIKLAPDYANAQYFLGLSYARLNSNDDAVKQFENLAKTNPDNQEVIFILSNLRAGKSPFADAKPPVTPTPEKRSKLPVTERR